MLARQLTAKVILSGVDVTRELAPYLKSIRYSDVLSGSTDELELRLEDAAGLFIGEWLPEMNMTLEVELTDGRTYLPLGLFTLEEVEASYPPSEFHLKGSSCSENSGLRQVDSSKSWEGVHLSQIARDIAEAAQVQLVYESGEDPLIGRAEQGEESRLAFLAKICADEGLALKVADGKLILFDEEELEKGEAVSRLIRAESAIKSFRVRATLTEIYKSCEVTYRHGRHAQEYKALATSSRVTGKVLKLNKKVDSQAEAERLARKSLRSKNKEEVKVNMTLQGDFSLLSGNVVELIGHGSFDGRYIIEKSTHEIGTGYECRLEMRRCL